MELRYSCFPQWFLQEWLRPHRKRVGCDARPGKGQGEKKEFLETESQGWGGAQMVPVNRAGKQVIAHQTD